MEKLLYTFDGGGLLGCGPSLLMRKMSKSDFYRKPDAYGGTSVGSLLAAAGAIGMPWDEIDDLFSIAAPIIFDPGTLEWRLDPRKPRYPHTGLRQILRDTFGQLRMCDTNAPLFVVVSDFAKGKPKIYDSTDGDLIGDVVLASCSAPTYFPPVQPGFCDGGLIANNPTMCALAGCKAKYGWDFKDIWCMSLGTNGDFWEDPGISENTNKLQWAAILLRSCTRMNEEMMTFYSRQLLGDRLLRIEPILTRDFGLDDLDGMSDYCSIWNGLWEMRQQEIERWFSGLHVRRFG